jgi:poly(ADP-ribose) glycohydrolase ARH3
MLVLATGDARRVPYEGGPLERVVWRLIGRTSDGCHRWIDDTQLAIDLAAALPDIARAAVPQTVRSGCRS